MTEDELRSAVERVRYGQSVGCQVDDYDYRRLAVAYLAEHPADDGELVTAVWVRMVFGPLRHDLDNDIIGPFGKLQAGLSYKGDKVIVWLNGVPLWMQGVESTATLTRGQFRKLCAALGIPLKEVA